MPVTTAEKETELTPTVPDSVQEKRLGQKVGAETSASKKVVPSSLLSRDVRARLTSLSPLKMASCLAIDFGLIAFAVLVCEAFANPVVYVLGVMLIGGRQAGIGDIGMHHGVHRTLVRNRKLNDLLGRTLSWLVAAPILTGYDAYRNHHLNHHRDANTHEDPDHEYFERVYEMPRWKAALLLVAPLTGVLYVLAIANNFRKSLRTKPLKVLVVSLGIVALIVGCYLGWYLCRLLVCYWFVPLATWGVFANQIRALAEHYPESEFQRGNDFPDVFRTREIINSWFDQCFLVTRGLNYHLSHHLCSQVPFYNLHELQQELAKSPLYQQHAHVTRGYHRFLFEYFGKRSGVSGLENPSG